MQVHRFQDAAAIALEGEGETRYLTAEEALKVGNALLAIAQSIWREKFADSKGLTVGFETFKSTYEMPNRPPLPHPTVRWRQGLPSDEERKH